MVIEWEFGYDLHNNFFFCKAIKPNYFMENDEPLFVIQKLTTSENLSIFCDHDMSITSQPVITCSKLTTETQPGVNHFQS